MQSPVCKKKRNLQINRKVGVGEGGCKQIAKINLQIIYIEPQETNTLPAVLQDLQGTTERVTECDILAEK
jgi:predicted nucleic acid-binding OB-fold protein